jgi:hypothetical protein
VTLEPAWSCASGRRKQQRFRHRSATRLVADAANEAAQMIGEAQVEFTE